MEEIFLKSAEGIQSKLRKRGQGESFSFMHSLRNTTNENERNEIKKPITGRDFMVLLLQKMRKKRFCIRKEDVLFGKNSNFI